MIRLATILACISLVHGTTHADNAEPQHTLAVISVDAGASQSIADDIMLKLSSDKSIRLVDRAHLDLIANEKTIASLGNIPAKHVKVGRLVGADVLVLVARENVTTGKVLHLRVCDCATGARIGRIRVPDGADHTDELVAEIRAALARFPNGIETIVNVADFLSHDLRLTYSHLQTDYADLIRELLSQKPGVAVVEIAEARSIALEQDRSGGVLHRRAPLFISGQYRTLPGAKGKPKVVINVTVRQGNEPLAKISSDSLTLDQAGEFLAGIVQQKLLKLLHKSSDPSKDVDAQFVQLVKQADRFSEIGEFERAAALREAALLLRPEADAHRIRLVQEYARQNQLPRDVLPAFHKRTLDNPVWTDVVARCRESWRRSLHHVEYLVRNRRVTRHVGGKLFSEAIHSIYAIRMRVASILTEEEKMKKEFVRNVGPALFHLEVSPNPMRRKMYGDQVAGNVMRMAFFRVDGDFVDESDLELAGDLLCEWLPADMPVSSGLMFRLSYGPNLIRGGRVAYDKAWCGFIERLASSPRPLVRAYAQYALLSYRRYRLNQVSEELLAEAKALVVSLGQEPLKTLDSDCRLRKAAMKQMRYIKNKLEKMQAVKSKRPQRKVASSKIPKPVVQPDGTLLCEKVRLKQLKITCLSQDKANRWELKGHKWRGASGCGIWQDLVPAWDGTDVIVAHGALLFVNADRIAREVLVSPKFSIKHVVFDGRYVWASGDKNQGVWVLDRNGRIVTHATPKHGLPHSFDGMPLHVLNQGRILIAGSIGQGKRGWLATIELSDKQPRVKVFHEAVKVWCSQSEEVPLKMAIDPAMRFQPGWIAEHRDEDGKRWIFVGRKIAPLMIDRATLDVRVYPIRKIFDKERFPRLTRPSSAFLSRDGLFYVAGSMNDYRAFRLNGQTQRFQLATTRSVRCEHCEGSPQGRLVVHNGYLYYVGARRWLRHHFETGREEVLIASPRSLPDFGSGWTWNLAVSRCFGLVAWHKGILYQVRCEPPEDRVQEKSPVPR